MSEVEPRRAPTKQSKRLTWMSQKGQREEGSRAEGAGRLCPVLVGRCGVGPAEAGPPPTNYQKNFMPNSIARGSVWMFLIFPN